MNLLYNSERTAYKSPKTDDCPFCSKYKLNDEYEHLIPYRTMESIIMLNKFPYNPGHLLVMPHAHGSSFPESEMERESLFRTLGIAIKAVKEVCKTEDINIGINMGKSSGGSVQDHLHIHIVPRFVGDTNFLAVLADTKVVTKDLKTMYDAYRDYFNKS